MVKLAIIGAGNIGLAIAEGFVYKKYFAENEILLAGPHTTTKLAEYGTSGYQLTTDNVAAVKEAPIVLLAVRPQVLPQIVPEIAPALTAGQLLLSVVSGVSLQQLADFFPKSKIARIMPNTAAAVGETMTAVCSLDAAAEEQTVRLFNNIGTALPISEELMTPVTALVGSGIAFFLRAIRAASQGGTQIGFHAHEAQLMAAQVAKGAAALLLAGGHAETEIDKVTTPKGCTIAGLNAMEHEGFSNAMITAVVAAAQKAENLYKK